RLSAAAATVAKSSTHLPAQATAFPIDYAHQEAAMKYVRLGRTGLNVSALCLGTMNFGPLTSERDSAVLMDQALELGFNFFDTANVYGWTPCEAVTEQILRRC